MISGIQTWESAAGAGGRDPTWIFIHGTDRVEKDLMVLFFGLVFFRCHPPWKFFADALACNSIKISLQSSHILTVI